MSNHREVNDIYKAFKAYVDDEFRGDLDFPDIKVCSFDQMPEMGMDHLIIYLDNATGGGGDLIQRIERFRPGTKVRFVEGAVSQSVKCCVTVPLRDARQSRHHHHGEEVAPAVSAVSGFPQPMEFVKWQSLTLALLVVAWKSTAWSDWQSFAQLFGVAL